MVDLTTLPAVAAGGSIASGQRFEVLGQGFDLWPAEILCSYDSSVILEDGSARLMLRVVERSNTRLILESVAEVSYSVSHVFEFFGTPYDVPRQLLGYEPRV